MIGVAVRPRDLDVVTEFFELFKTPWEIASPGTTYDVVLVADDETDIDRLQARAVLTYRAKPYLGHAVETVSGPVTVRWNDVELPIYGDLTVFTNANASSAATSHRGPVEFREQSGSRTICAIGYDLFAEVRRLLTEGQPKANAPIPTLELHIALLRDRLEQLGVSVVEIPARPHGYDFLCCLTHDVDFCGVTKHRFDDTLAGFLWRASVGTLVGLARGERNVSEARQNWTALLTLPFAHVGLVRDFWNPFDDYAEADRGRPATFFVIPFKGRPGIAPDGTIKRRRAVQYGVREISEQLNAVCRRGSEVALHGIDAWRNEGEAQAELAELQAAAPEASNGVRMHWLFFDASASPRRLEAANFAYDATCGYNDAIGHRAGTTQAFTFPGTRLLELPLSIMDTAMFYRDRMGLAFDQALVRCRRVLSNLQRFGGALVINWHDRSLAPERLWRRAYDALLDEIDSNHSVWYATAEQAIAWFSWRRSIRFAYDFEKRAVRIDAPQRCAQLPAASVIVAARRRPTPETAGLRFDGSKAMTVSI